MTNGQETRGKLTSQPLHRSAIPCSSRAGGRAITIKGSVFADDPFGIGVHERRASRLYITFVHCAVLNSPDPIRRIPSYMELTRPSFLHPVFSLLPFSYSPTALLLPTAMLYRAHVYVYHTYRSR